MVSMVIPTVTENEPPRRDAGRDDFAGVAETPVDRVPEPRRTPYHRASQRELVRMSLDYDYRQHDVYPVRRNRRV